MSNKKSYMDKSNIINEGILDKIFDFIKNKKVKKLEKDFKNQPGIKKKIQRLDKVSSELEVEMKKLGYDWKPSEGGWTKTGEEK